MKTYSNILHAFLLVLLFSSCSEDGLPLFSIEDDKELGAQVDEQIENDPSFTILSETAYPDAYAYLNTMKQQILDGGEVRYKDEFLWQLHIIHDDSTLNAFATPGGYIYIYTGLIKYLEDASSLAGVLGHEIAHADKRHSVKQMQKQFGIQLLFEVITGGDPGLLSDVAAGLWALKFSRNDETEADNSSVAYLCPTDFEAAGAANFFQKIVDDGNPTPPQFLSTHPNPDNRVSNIHEQADAKNCGEEHQDPLINNLNYEQFQALLP